MSFLQEQSKSFVFFLISSFPILLIMGSHHSEYLRDAFSGSESQARVVGNSHQGQRNQKAMWGGSQMEVSWGAGHPTTYLAVEGPRSFAFPWASLSILRGKREKASVRKVALISTALHSTCLGVVWGRRPELAGKQTGCVPIASQMSLSHGCMWPHV